MPPFSDPCARRAISALGFPRALVWVFAAPSAVAQHPLLEVFAPASRPRADVVACGLLAPSSLPPGGADARDVALRDGAGEVVRGRLRRREGHVAVFVELPPGPAGARTFALDPRAGPPPPRASTWAASGGALSCRLEGGALDLLPDGACRYRGFRLAPRPAPAVSEGWTLREDDPLRSVAAWRGSDPSGARLEIFLVAEPGTGKVSLSFVAETASVEESASPRGWELRRDGAEDGDLFAPGDAPDEDASADARDAAAPDAAEEDAPPAANDSGFDPWGEADLAAFRAQCRHARPYVLLAGESAVAATFADPLCGPRRVREGAAGAVLLDAIAAGERLDAGEARRLDVFVAVGAAPPAAAPWARPTRPVDPCAGDEREPAPPVRSGAPPSVLAAADEALRAWRADPRRGLGFRRGDAGDWRLDAARAGNLEWDTTRGLLLRHLATGGAEDRGQALFAAEHLLQRDRDAARSGLFFMHGAGHRSGVVEPGHHWTEGLRLAAALTDDPRLRDAVRRVADEQARALARIDPRRALPRSLGWGLRSLAALHPCATDRKASTAAVRRLRDHILAQATPEGRFALERAGPEPDALIRATPFVDAGVVLPALLRAEAVDRGRDVRERVRRAASVVARDAYDREDGRRVLRATLWCEPVRGRCVKKTGEAEGEERLLFLAGLAAVGAPGARDPAEIAAALGGLAWRSKTFVGKEVSMLLRAAADWAP